MKYSLQFSDAIHVLAYIEMFQDTRSLSSEMIASSIETNAANVRKIMSQLKKSGLIFTKTGKPQPSLAKSPDQIWCEYPRSFRRKLRSAAEKCRRRNG